MLILLVGVNVLHVALAVYQVRDGADKVLAGVEHLQHGPPVRLERQPVVELHLARQPGVVAGCPVQKVRALLLHHGNALALALVEDSRVGHAQNGAAPEHGVVLFGFPDHPRLLQGQPDALVGGPGAAVQLPDAVKPALFVRRIPPHEKGFE